MLVNYWLVKDSYQKKHGRDQPNPVQPVTPEKIHFKTLVISKPLA